MTVTLQIDSKNVVYWYTCGTNKKQIFMQIVDGAKRGWVVEGVGPCRHLKTVIEKRVEDMEDSIFIRFQNSSKINLSTSLINTKPKNSSTADILY